MSNLVPRQTPSGIVFGSDIFDSFDNFFRDVLDGAASKRSSFFNNQAQTYPKADLFIKDGKFYIELALAGMSEKDINIEQFNEGSASFIKISGTMAKYENADYLVRGLTRTSFSKTINVPEGVSGEPSASMTNGLLSISWDLPQKQVTSKKIEVNAKERPSKTVSNYGRLE